MLRVVRVFVVALGRALVECGWGVVVGGGCSSGDGFQALHCSRFNWVAFSVYLCGCSGCRFLTGRLRDEIGGLRVVLVGVGGGVVWSGCESDLFLWVLGWVWRAWFVEVGGWPSSFFC